jgi:hypothetical protein
MSSNTIFFEDIGFPSKNGASSKGELYRINPTLDSQRMGRPVMARPRLFAALNPSIHYNHLFA